MITREDYEVMEVEVNGEWIKADVFKTLSNGMAMYLKGEKTSDGSYMMGACVPATSYRPLQPEVKTETRVKSKEEILKILVDDGYLPNGIGDFEKRFDLSFVAGMWKCCGTTDRGNYKWKPEWLEEVPVED